MIVFYTNSPFYKCTLSILMVIFVQASFAQGIRQGGGENFSCSQIEAGVGANNLPNLFWASQNETSNDYFEVQRAEDGKNFKTIAMVFGPEDGGGKVYGFEDATRLKTRRAFYRLKLMDESGTVGFSDVVTIEVKQPRKSMQVYPLLCKNEINLDLIYNQTREADLSICNLDGSVLKTHAVQLNPGKNSVAFNDLSSLGSGMYTLALTSGGKLISSQKFVIQ